MNATTWFGAGLALFAAGAVAGLAFAALGPLPFIRGLGLVAALAGALGMALSLLGRRLDAPSGGATARRAEPALRAHDDASALPVAAAASERLPVWPGVGQPI